MKYLPIKWLRAPKLGLLAFFFWFFPCYLACAELIGPAWFQIKDKPTAIASSGITDVYTKDEVLGLIASSLPTRENVTLSVATTTVTFTTNIVGTPTYFYLFVNGLLLTNYTVVSSTTVELIAEVATGSQVVGMYYGTVLPPLP